MLERVDWRRDLHFHTCTTIDTLDYSGDDMNMGSKVVIAAAGGPVRNLATTIPGDLRLPEGVSAPRVALPGVLVVEVRSSANVLGEIWGHIWIGGDQASHGEFPLIVLVDDSEFTARSLGNFLWVTFTRSNPARDLDGIGAFTEHKHWGCSGPLIIDARIKPHHAPPLVEDPLVTKKIDAFAARGGPLARWL